MSGMRGINFSIDKRSSGRCWSARPHAKNKAARAAWDHFAATGSIRMIRLIEGKWCCYRPGAGHAVMADATKFKRSV